MSAPKVKASDAASIILGFLLACCSEKATGNRKKRFSPESLLAVIVVSVAACAGESRVFSPCNELAPSTLAGVFLAALRWVKALQFFKRLTASKSS